MTAYTSSGSGNWNDSATWGGAGVPTSGDTATIAATHTVTIPSGISVTVGTGSGTAITFTATTAPNRTKLVINGTLDLNGAMSLAAESELALGAGSTFDLNGFSVTRGGKSYYNWIGTSGSRATVISSGSAGTMPVAVYNLTTDMQYVDISGLGDAEYGRTHTTSGATVSYQYCSWYNCGYVYLDGTGNQANQGFTVSHCDFRDPSSDASTHSYPYLYQTQALGTSQRLVSYCTWSSSGYVCRPIVRAPGAEYFGCVFDGVNFATECIAKFNACLFANIVGAYGDSSKHYEFKSGYVYYPSSAHPFGYITATSKPFALEDSVLETDHSNDFGVNWMLMTTPPTGTLTVSGNVFIGGGTLVAFTQSGAAGTVTIRNNTVCIDNDANGNDYPTLLLTEQTGDITGGTINIYNNLVVDPDTTTAMDKAIYLRTNTANQVDLCDYNCGWGVPGGAQSPPLKYYDSDGQMTEHGTNDISEDPDFQDSTRDIASWDTSVGGSGTAANAITEFLKMNGYGGTWDSDYNVAALVAWVRAGFVTHNMNLANGYSSGYIGALEPAPIGAMPKRLGGVQYAARIKGVW